MPEFDAVVVGLGAMGSAALYHLAERGAKVAGIDALSPPHTLGSTHGRTRIIREAYFEHPSYVPLVRRAYENWDALASKAGIRLFTRTGAIMIGTPDSSLVRGTLASAALHNIDVEHLTAPAIGGRYSAFSPEVGMVGVLERNAGVLVPEACIIAYLALALDCGADVRVDSPVLGLTRAHGSVTVHCATGDVTARRVVLCAGPWTSDLLAMLGTALPLTVERQTMHWLERASDPALSAPGQFPVVMFEHDGGHLFYAIPDMGDGVKTAVHHDGAFVTPQLVSRLVEATDTEPVLALVRRFIPGALAPVRESAVCLYTDTPDGDFVIDMLPDAPEVVLVSACSGHGFKFTSAIGEVAAQLAFGEAPSVDISRFAIRPFA